MEIGEGDMEVDIERRRKAPWHISREVSLSHIFTTIAVVASAIVAWNKLDARVSVVEHEVSRTQTENKQFADKLEKKLDQIQNGLDAINTKFLAQAQADLIATQAELAREKKSNDDLRNRNPARP